MTAQTVVICIAVAVIAALVVVLAMKSALKTARWDSYAANYIDDGSFEITASEDRYIRTSVITERIRNDNNQ